VSLNTQTGSSAEHWGADFFGVADLAPARSLILAQGGPGIARYQRAVSLGIALPHSVVDRLPRRTERAVAVDYRAHAYDVINQRLDLVASRVSGFLQSQGHDALPIPAAQRVDDERLCAEFSHKLAAHLAGLGWIGKNCLLITPGAGPRVRWTTVLTDAPLAETGQAMDERCGDCEQCVEICPVNAFAGRAFRTGEPREVRFDARKCDGYFAEMRQQDPEVAVCGMCLYVCPYGRSRVERVP
jgi:epoxyqueuosine reductase